MPEPEFDARELLVQRLTAAGLELETELSAEDIAVPLPGKPGAGLFTKDGEKFLNRLRPHVCGDRQVVLPGALIVGLRFPELTSSRIWTPSEEVRPYFLGDILVIHDKQETNGGDLFPKLKEWRLLSVLETVCVFAHFPWVGSLRTVAVQAFEALKDVEAKGHFQVYDLGTAQGGPALFVGEQKLTTTPQHHMVFTKIDAEHGPVSERLTIHGMWNKH